MSRRKLKHETLCRNSTFGSNLLPQGPISPFLRARAGRASMFHRLRFQYKKDVHLQYENDMTLFDIRARSCSFIIHPATPSNDHVLLRSTT